MKLIKVILFNLASLEGLHEIDFESEPLRSADLFSIVGETGSGKSTILDAICLALYGTAPRFEGARNFKYYHGEAVNKDQSLAPDDPRNILRRGTKKCSAEVWFQARDGEYYKAIWSCSFARTNYKSEERWFYRLKREGALLKVDKELTIREKGSRGNAGLDQVIGLDYNQFTRTVMLAQNSFANFIKAKDEEKAILLEKLTGTQVYSVIAEKINAFYKEAKTAKDELKNEVDALGGNCLTKEELEKRVWEARQLEAAYSGVEARLKALETHEKWCRQKAALVVALEKERQELMEAKAQAESVRELRDQLREYDLATAIQNDFLDYQRLVRDKGDLSARLAAYRESHVRLTQEMVAKKELLDVVSGLLSQAKQRQQEMIPRLTLARQRKVELEALRKQGEEAGKQAREALEALNRLEKQCQENKLGLETTAKGLSEEQRCLEALAKHQKLIDSMAIVLNRLECLKKTVEECDRLEATIQKNSQLLAVEEKKRLDAQGQLEKLRAREQELTQQETLLGDHLAQYDLDKLRNDSSEATKRRQAGERCESLQNVLEKNQKSLAEETVILRELEGQLTAWEKREAQLIQERESIQVVLPGLEEAYQLAAGEGAEAMRATLRAGECCPVCGSREHPFAAQDGAERYLSPIKTEIVRKRNRQEEIRRELEDKKVGIRTLYSKGVVQKGELAGSLDALRKERERSLTEWESFRQAYVEIPAWESSATTMVADLLAKFNEKARREETEANERFRVYQVKQVQLTQIRQDKIKLETSLRREEENCRAIETRLTALNTTLAEQKNQQEKYDMGIRQEKEALTDFFLSIPDWEQRFSSDYPVWVEQLKSLYDRYEQAIDRRRELLERQGQLNLLREDLQERIVTAQELSEKRNRTLEQARAAIGVGELAYQSVLDGKDPDLVENELNKAVQTHEKRKEEVNQEFNRLVEACGRQDESIKLTTSELENTRTQETEKIGRISAWLEEQNRMEDTPGQWNMERLTYLFAPEREWRMARERIRRLDESVQQAMGRVENCQKNLEEHERSETRTDEPLDTLLQAMKEEQAHKEELDMRRKEVAGLLFAHQQAERQVAERQPELKRRERVFANWDKLNGILGNAEGKRFRETAQCFTLRFLIHQANAQLRLLNQRYSLEQVKDSLGIRVIDHDRADEVRNLSSLSGGETFLVSLGLALGLSSLSSRNIQISNLFVDEGFGTLDSENLNIVIDALSGLRTMQGKKVGVISHTPEMRERIHTQIQVIKAGASGRSELKIVG